jgi:hypothetical protein
MNNKENSIDYNNLINSIIRIKMGDYLSVPNKEKQSEVGKNEKV